MYSAIPKVNSALKILQRAIYQRPHATKFIAMQIKGTIKDRYATIVIDGNAVKLHQQGHYRLLVKGLPTLWTAEYAHTLIRKCLEKQGLTHVALTSTSCTLNKWNACVRFYNPIEIVCS